MVTVISLPLLIKRNMSELKFQSKILFIGVITLLTVLTIKQFEVKSPVDAIEKIYEFSLIQSEKDF